MDHCLVLEEEAYMHPEGRLYHDSPPPHTQFIRTILWAATPVTWRLRCSESHCEMKWQRGLPRAGQSKCSACRQRLCIIWTWNLSFSWGTFSNYFFCLKKLIQIQCYRIHFLSKTYKVLLTRGVWRKGYPVKEIIVPLKGFFFQNSFL